MKTKIVFLFVACTLLIACNKSKLYSEFSKFSENNRWEKSVVKNYEFNVEDDTLLYDLTFQFSHVYDYQFNSVPIIFSVENPEGIKENFTIDLVIKDPAGKELAECSGDICDLDFKIKEKAKLLKGKYKVSVANGFNGPYLPNVIGIGLKVTTVE
jgi:gliding motility-associated lipoprotein GldH